MAGWHQGRGAGGAGRPRVGCWVQDEAGTVRVRLVEPVPVGVRQALDAEAARLTDWLAGVRIPATYVSPAMRTASA